MKNFIILGIAISLMTLLAGCSSYGPSGSPVYVPDHTYTTPPGTIPVKHSTYTGNGS